MLNHFSYTPLHHNANSFNALDSLLASIGKSSAKSDAYPHYNIEKIEADKHIITLAVPGFSEKELNIVLHNDRLVVSAKTEAVAGTLKKHYIARGITRENFEISFQLASHSKVHSANLANGLLIIEVLRELPEEKKPHLIAINTAEAVQTQEDKHFN